MPVVVRFVLVCAAGAVGTGARFLVVTGLARWAGPAFPWGTLTVNVIGSFLLGGIMELGLRGALDPDLRVVLAAGAMGGFTTYSSFNYEALAFFGRGAWVAGGGYLLATVLGCFVAGGLGMAAARAVLGG